MTESTSDLIEQLQQATREAHEAIRDLNRLRREIADEIASIPGKVHKCMEDSLNAALDEGRQGLKEAYERSAKSAERAIYERFNNISAILMGRKDAEYSIEKQAEVIGKVLRKNGIHPDMVAVQRGTIPPALRRALDGQD